VRKLSALIVVAALVVPSLANAQLRGDIGAYGGVSQRVIASHTGGGALPGPMVGLEGHIALFPLLRLGAYVHGEISPTNDQVAAREMLGGGLRLKVIPPWPRGDWRIWAALGIGYMAAYSPSYTQTLHPLNGSTTTLSVDSAGGGFLEVPLSIGAEYRKFKPFMLFAEITGRFGFGFSGTLYGANAGRGAKTDTGAPEAIVSDGGDVFAIGAALGLGFDL
jgi:hypothetical protein